MKPPGAGTGGVPLQTLYGFDRVHVPAGKTITVELYPSVSAAARFAVLSAEVSRRCCAAACRVLPGRREGRALRAARRVQCAPPPPPRRTATSVGSDLLCAQPSTLASAESTPANTAWATRSTRSRWSEGHPPSRNGKDLAQRCFARPVMVKDFLKIRPRRRRRAQRRRQPPCARGAGRRSPSRQALHPAPPRRRPGAAPAPAGRGRRRPAHRAAG